MFDPGIALAQGISAVVESNPKHALGDRIVYGDNLYVYAHNASTAAIDIGAGLDIVTACSGPYSLVVTGGSDVAYKAVNKNVTVPTGNYFWACIKGPVAMKCTSAAKAAGVLLFANSGATGAVQAASAPTGVLTAFGDIDSARPHAVAHVLQSAGANDATVNAYFWGREFA